MKRRWSDSDEVKNRPRLMVKAIPPDHGPYCRVCMCSWSGMKESDRYCGPACWWREFETKHPKIARLLPRWWHAWFATTNGYFWLACDICHSNPTGGHEKHDWNRGIVIGFSSPHDSFGALAYPRPGHVNGRVCARPECVRIANELSRLQAIRDGYAVNIAERYNRRAADRGITTPEESVKALIKEGS